MFFGVWAVCAAVAKRLQLKCIRNLSILCFLNIYILLTAPFLSVKRQSTKFIVSTRIEFLTSQKICYCVAFDVANCRPWHCRYSQSFYISNLLYDFIGSKYLPNNNSCEKSTHHQMLCNNYGCCCCCNEKSCPQNCSTANCIFV